MQYFQILIYYGKTQELGELLKEYVKKNPDYINAYKYLYKYQQFYEPKSSLFTLQVRIDLILTLKV